MSRRAAKVTQAAIVRALRAAKQTGAGSVRILPDGTISIDPYPANDAAVPAAAAPRRRFGDRLKERAEANADPLAVAYAQWQRGELNIDQLPPGRYPNGIRAYAEGEWEAEVRASPLQKRERAALEAYFRAKGTIGYVKGGGRLTTERLAARRYVEIIQTRPDGRIPYYGITAAGEAEWLRQTSRRDKVHDNAITSNTPSRER